MTAVHCLKQYPHQTAAALTFAILHANTFWHFVEFPRRSGLLSEFSRQTSLDITRPGWNRLSVSKCVPSSTREGNATAAAAVFQPLLADLCTVVLLTFLLTYWRCYLLTPCDRLIYVHSTWRRQLMTSYKLLILCCCWSFSKQSRGSTAVAATLLCSISHQK